MLNKWDVDGEIGVYWVGASVIRMVGRRKS